MAKTSLVPRRKATELARKLDADLWRARGPGGAEGFDAERFGELIAALMDAGIEAAAEQLAALDPELVTAGFSQHLRVFHQVSVAPYATLDGEVVPGWSMDGRITTEVGGYVVEARRQSAWEPIVELLEFLGSERPGYFHDLMSRCVRLSSSPAERNGFHGLPEAADQQLFGLACERETRRERQGFVPPPHAQAFLREARAMRLAGPRPALSPLAHAYFRDIGSARPAGGETREGTHQSDEAMVPAAYSFVHAYAAAHARCEEELAYLVNVAIAGVTVQGRPLTPREAADAAVSIGNLGLENWPDDWGDADLITAFQAGWLVLYRDVGLYAARRLADVLLDVRCIDREIQMRLDGLRSRLLRCVRDGEPWRAREALEIVMMLDAPSWAALAALLDECPVMHGAVTAARQGRRTISATEFSFVARNAQIDLVREFLAALPAVLTG
jgi:hypothetical protein